MMTLIFFLMCDQAVIQTLAVHMRLQLIKLPCRVH